MLILCGSTSGVWGSFFRQALIHMKCSKDPKNVHPFWDYLFGPNKGIVLQEMMC